jgi:oligopeptide/dipeptide ABC transporter ATP-binding protein
MIGPILEISGLNVVFRGATTPIPAVRGIDLRLAPGEVLGLVGESGSGKSVSMRAVLGLLPATAHVTGSVRFLGEELVDKSPGRLRALRGARMSMIFQDPMTALNPVIPIGKQISEAIRIHNRAVGRREGLRRARDLLDLVAIPSPEHRLREYPFEMSGGMRQRVVIAIAVANDPELLIADEPTTALDVTVQAQILEVLRRLRDRHRIGMVLITHDFGVIAGLADRVAVMYAGRIVETAPVDELFDHPRHPYTQGLLRATPHIHSGVVQGIEGTPPAPNALTAGCAFAPRCGKAVPACYTDDPALRPVAGALVACHVATALAPIPADG